MEVIRQLSEVVTIELKLRALLCSTVAGAATLLGGCSLCFVKRFKPIPFCIALALSAGVMMWVTLVEIVTEANSSCIEGVLKLKDDDCLIDPSCVKKYEGLGYMLSSVCILSGWIVSSLVSRGLEYTIDKLGLSGNLNFDEEGYLHKNSKNQVKECGSAVEEGSDSYESISTSRKDEDVTRIVETLKQDTEDWDEQKAIEMVVANEGPFTTWLVKNSSAIKSKNDVATFQIADTIFRSDQREFLRMGLFTAVALGIHNIPEGMATFASYVEEPNLGIAMGIAIAVHNVPEGIAVAVPAYFGTGSAPKALGLCAVSMFGEFIGAFIQWGIVELPFDQTLMFGISMGFVAGFMFRVAIAELFVGAMRYDPLNVVCVRAFAAGCAVMCLSLMLLTFAGE